MPERLGEDALAQKIGEAVLDALGIAMIREARREPGTETDPLVGGTEQHHATIRADSAAVESAHKFAPARASEVHLGLATLCRHRGAPLLGPKSLSQMHFR